VSQHILVVDDDPETVFLFSFILKRAGYKVATAFNGKSALERAQQARPDLVLLDVMMPEVDGFDVTRRLRAQQDMAATPIVMLTAHARVSDHMKGILAGATAYLVKPIAPAELVQTLREVLAVPVA
jgi:two-component system phosphate regulon response regulator PhoB